MSSFSKMVEFDIPKKVGTVFESKLVKQLIKQQEYDGIEIEKWVDGNPNKDYNKIVFHIQDTGNLIEFRKRKNKKESPVLNFQNISTESIIEETKKGFLREKKDKLLGVTLRDGSEIFINVKDKEAETILKDLQVLKTMDTVNYWRSIKLPYENDNGTITNIEILPGTPFIARNEVLLWYRIETKGLVHKNVTWIDAITNYRIFQYNFENHGAGYIILTSLDDVAVKNRYRVSHGQNYGFFTGQRYGSMRSGFYNSTGNSKSTSIGDLVFIANGRPFVQFNQVADPSGVVKLVESARKHLRGLQRAVVKTEKINDVTHDEINGTVCPDCNFSNSTSSKYCNQCGVKLNVSI
jgi:hypothetical protein